MSTVNEIKRITIKVNSQFHNEIKKRALRRNITMTKYVMRALWEQIQKEKVYEK